MNTRVRNRAIMLTAVLVVIITVSARLKADTGTCAGAGTTLPFTDVPGSNIFFCSIAEAYVSGLTNGTSATTYSPSDPVTREQMGAFVTRTMDQSLKRGSRRAALDQFWTTKGPGSLGLTPSINTGFGLIKSDGADLWVADGHLTVTRVRASDSKKLGEWTGAGNLTAVLAAMGKVFITSQGEPFGGLYEIDPTQAPGSFTPVTTALGGSPAGIAFDGQRIWTANFGGGGSVSIVSLNPVSVTTVAGFGSSLVGIIYDGANMWVTNLGNNTISKLDSNGHILQSALVGSGPQYPAFDGTNIWVPNTLSHSVTVVRATGPLSGTVLATLTGNGLNGPVQAAFDGERIMVTNKNGDSVSLWKASDLTPIGAFSTGAGTGPSAVCSDGLNFWIALGNVDTLARF